jgi:hypothetical protein
MILDDKLNIQDEQVELLPVVKTFSSKSTEIQKIENVSLAENKKEILVEKIGEDFNRTREALQESIDINLSALRLVSENLQRTPRDRNMGEVLARLLESITSLNQQYLNSSRQYLGVFKDILTIEEGKKETVSPNGINIQNAIFTGTMNDLIKMIPTKPI